jgi:hypothetical protein
VGTNRFGPSGVSTREPPVIKTEMGRMLQFAPVIAGRLATDQNPNTRRRKLEQF